MENNSKLTIFFSASCYALTEKNEEALHHILKIVSKKKSHFVVLFVVGKRKIQRLNFQYRKINKATDVLAFPFYYSYHREVNLSLKPQELGEIFICYPVAKNQAQKFGHSLKKEICFLFLHGLLHLLGYNHEEKNEEKIMFSLQDKIMSKLNI